MAEVDFDPNLRLQSTFYHVPGYESDIHALTSPIPAFPKRDALSAIDDMFQREQLLSSEAYHQRPPVILVHGMVVASSYMHDLGRHLAPWFRVFIPDLPGFGRSSKALNSNDEISISQLAIGLHDWMNMVGIKKAHFVSNSLGCQILTEFTRRWPDRVDRLVLQGPSMDKSRQPVYKTFLALASNNQNEPASLSFVSFRDYWRAGLRKAWKLVKEVTAYRIQDVLPNLKHPALFLSCEFDPIAPSSWVDELSRRKPNAVHYVLKQAGHTANYSATEKMSRCILRYLLIQDDDQMRKAGRETFHEIVAINQTREEAAKERSRLLRSQLLITGSVLALFKSKISHVWAFVALIVFMEMTILYRIYELFPLLSTRRSDHLDRIYVKLQGIADFDSASSMLRAVSRHLHFRDFPQLGIPTSLAAAMPSINYLPSSLRNTVYSQLGASEATDDVATTFDAEQITSSVVAHFPPHRKYPAVAIGSSNGALTHLYTAMGVPWLPQTLLMPVKRPKNAAIKHGQLDMTASMEWSKSTGADLLRNNPNIELYHMDDPNQDQLMIHHMAYFRIKFIRLTEAYREFLLNSLGENGTIILVRCRLKWPSTKIAERHYFQSGAVGGISPEEFIKGSDSVENFIASQRSFATKLADKAFENEHRTDWNAPLPNCEVPEAEWGYSEGLTEDIVVFAKEYGFQIKYVDYNHPEDVSPLVADAYRQWQKQLNRPTGSILVESFILAEPWLSIRYNLTPFWSVFSVKPSLERLRQYLEKCEKTDRSYQRAIMFLFCSGVHSVGLAEVEEWKAVLKKHLGQEPDKNDLLLLGTDDRSFPKDFGFPARYHSELVQAVDATDQYVMPPSLPLDWFENFMIQNGNDYGVHYSA